MTPAPPSYYQRSRPLWHLLFWLAIWLYPALIYGSAEGNFRTELTWGGLYMPVKMAATYFTLYLLIPRYFVKRRIVRFCVYLVLTLLAAALLQWVLDFSLYTPLMNVDMAGVSLFQPAKILKIVLGIYPVVALAAFIKVGKHWYEQDRESRELQKDKLEAELKFLKAQIHPHFLFNTLNNLYALTLKRSERASEVVLKLSDLLNYMLYECDQPKVPLAKELDLLENYIALEKIRYGDRLRVRYSVAGETAGREIPPMLLLPFVENAFKHGVSEQLEEAWVRIAIDVENAALRLSVENSKNPAAGGDPQDALGYKEGIGLTNVKRRLQLLYGEAYRLRLKEGEDSYSVELSLQLDAPLKPEVP